MRRIPNFSGVSLPRYPTTGIAGCCARAASGQATADPAITLINSRRLMLAPRGSGQGIVAGQPAGRPRKGGPTYVRFGSKADMCSAKSHVRFTPESGHLCVERYVRSSHVTLARRSGAQALHRGDQGFASRNLKRSVSASHITLRR